MTYHRAQLKRSAKVAMSETRPRAWLVTLLFLLLGAAVTALFGFLAPEPLGDLAEPITEALEEAVDYAAATGDLDRALEEFQLELEDELRDELEDYFGDGIGQEADREELTGFLFYLLAGGVLAGLAAWALSLVASLINVIFSHGYYSYCLGVFRRQSPSAGKLFSAFPRTLTVLGSHIMVGVFSFLWSLLGIVAGSLLIVLAAVILPEVAAVIVGVILYLAAIFFIVVIVLRYALVPYIVVEDREVGVFDAIRRSKQLMKGNKLRMLVLALSFLGWGLLIVFLTVAVLLVGILIGALIISVTRSILIAGAVMAIAVGAAILLPFPLSLWLTVYQNVTFAGFYHIVSFPPEEEGMLEETLVMEPAAVAAAMAAGEPVWSNAPEEEILPVAAEAPAEETPAEEAPAEEAPAEETPAEEAPAEEAPTEEAPAEEAPAEEAPAEESPAEETPEEETKE